MAPSFQHPADGVLDTIGRHSDCPGEIGRRLLDHQPAVRAKANDEAAALVNAASRTIHVREGRRNVPNTVFESPEGERQPIM
jgi:hypothetical protein